MHAPLSVRVPFQGEQLEAVSEGARLWVSLRRICEALMLSFPAQTVKLRAKLWATVAMIATVADDGRRRSVTCIDLDSLPMWLATIDAGRVAPAIRPKLLAYQREAAKVLRDHFFGAKPTAAPGLSAEEVRALVREEIAAAGSHGLQGRGSRNALSGRKSAPVDFWAQARGDSGGVIDTFLQQHDDGGQPIGAEELYQCFRIWANANNAPRFSIHVFGRLMLSRSTHERHVTNRGRFYRRRPVIVAEGVQ